MSTSPTPTPLVGSAHDDPADAGLDANDPSSSPTNQSNEPDRDETSEPPAPKARRSGLAWFLVVLLVIAFAGSAAVNWLQYETIRASQSQGLSKTLALQQAEGRAEIAEAAYSDLRSLVDNVNQEIATLQVRLSKLATLTGPPAAETSDSPAK